MPSSENSNSSNAPEPPWNAPGAVQEAIVLISGVSNKNKSWSACNQFLYAIGNNHAGTYYPVVLVASPKLGLILSGGSRWSIFAALNALVDILGSFEPELGYEEYQGQSLRRLVHESIALLAAPIEAISRAGLPNSDTALELLELIHEQ